MSEQKTEIPQIVNNPEDAQKLSGWFLNLDQPLFEKTINEWKTADRHLYDQTLLPWVEKIKEIIELKHLTNPTFLGPLWLYYHHSAQIAYLNHREDEGRQKIDQALTYQQQIPGHGNKVTGMLALIYHGKNKEAIEYAPKNQDADDGPTLKQLITFYKLA